MSKERKIQLRDLVKKTWHHGFGNYMQHAFPEDELRPLSCQGFGQDHSNPNNFEINDVLGDFSLTLIDNLDTFVALQDRINFTNAVRHVLRYIPNFDLDSRIQVFETTIRVLGGLLSGHLFAKDDKNLWGFRIEGYQDELLLLARDLADRLLPAFQASKTGIPYARINLRHGIAPGEGTETCTAGAGSLLLEFATLSRLSGNPVYEDVAKKAFFALWDRRSSINLFGNTINLQTGQWAYGISSIGAGIDSYYEYILKSYVLLQDDTYFELWDQAYKSVMTYMRSPDGFWYRGVNMQTGAVATTTIDSLAAFWPGLQVLAGDVEAAIQSHLTYANLWQRYSGIPEVFDTYHKRANALGYPLRPEFIESNYFLYRATKDDYYLQMAERIIIDLVNRTWVDCGLASIGDLSTGKLEDRMHSFMLSETLKYLYLTFDEENPINHSDEPFVFTTEGHILYIPNADSMNHNQRLPTWQERKSLDSDEVTDETDTNPSGSGFPRKTQNKLGTCSIFSPSTKSMKYSSQLKLSIEGRTDCEYVKMLTGNQELMTNKNETILTKNAWLDFGLSEVPVSDEYLIELLFTHSDGSIIHSPGKDQMEVFAKSSLPSDYYHQIYSTPQVIQKDFLSEETVVLIKNITGLSFSIRKRLNEDSYDIVKVCSNKLPHLTKVAILDPYAIQALKSDKPNNELLSERDRQHLTAIRVSFELPFKTTTKPIKIERPVMMATFGPDVRIPGSANLSIGNPGLRIVKLKEFNEFGCQPIGLETKKDEKQFLKEKDPILNREDEDDFGTNDVHDKVVMVKRGNCTFHEKIKNLAKAGAKGVLIINHEENLLIPTSDQLLPRNLEEAIDSKQSLESSETTNQADDPDAELLKSIPLLFATDNTGRSIEIILKEVEKISTILEANPTIVNEDKPSTMLETQENSIQEDFVSSETFEKDKHNNLKAAMIEIIGNPLKLINTQDSVVINGYRLKNLILLE
ncbi:hypothetical protein O181_026603 [Austropuccinia psidii MF-1]|uniref:alpha-1,2-Mannosidase n=1 Tax=Austropuccinia psidii MF-1 TaxID=1389203 RepID=A0A9Q3CMW4_9BASI|nr:hypothetical protein [Austropuccinia psidii MF-1]